MAGLLTVAFAAGMVSTVNPCGFAMLPAYLGFFLGDGAARSRGPWRVALVVSAGFLAVFAATGFLFAMGLRALVGIIPWLALAVGIVLALVGFAQVHGRRLVPYLSGPGRYRREDSMRGMFLFGVSYAVASLSCTLPIFLSLVGGAVAARSATEALLTFVSYAVGMAIVVTGITVLVAGGRSALIGRIRMLGRRLDVVSGAVMALAGLFIVWYWATVLGSGSEVLGSNPMVRWVDRVSARTTGLIADNAGWVVLGVLFIATLALVRGRTRRDRTES
jgi:cytochrome c-type biogenesis protein